jgi:hypothetical protein
VKSMGFSMFFGCSSLASIDFGSSPKSEVPSFPEDAFVDVPNTCKFIIPLGMYDEWISASGWSGLYADGYKFEGYASTKQMHDIGQALEQAKNNKRDLTNNVSVIDGVQFTPWERQSGKEHITIEWGPDPALGDEYGPNDYYWLVNGNPISEDIDATELIDGGDLLATREKIIVATKGESFITSSYVNSKVDPLISVKEKIDMIAALEPPSSTVRDLITWANAVQAILRGELIGGDGSVAPSAVLSSSNKYYWDKDTETCYRMTVENDYTIMRAVTNVPPTVDVVLALEKELNQE